jgi:hypothetical protein
MRGFNKHVKWCEVAVPPGYCWTGSIGPRKLCSRLQQPRRSPHVGSQQRVAWRYWIAKNIWAFVWDTDLMGLQGSPLLSSFQEGGLEDTRFMPMDHVVCRKNKETLPRPRLMGAYGLAIQICKILKMFFFFSLIRNWTWLENTSRSS